jgi:hypothetical protein
MLVDAGETVDFNRLLVWKIRSARLAKLALFMACLSEAGFLIYFLYHKSDGYVILMIFVLLITLLIGILFTGDICKSRDCCILIVDTEKKYFEQCDTQNLKATKVCKNMKADIASLHARYKILEDGYPLNSVNESVRIFKDLMGFIHEKFWPIK